MTRRSLILLPALLALALSSGSAPSAEAQYFGQNERSRSGGTPSFLGGERKPVASAGVAMRANVLGFAVVELDFAHPFNRGKSWVWQFNFTPGF